MCGICGFWESVPNRQEVIREMVDIMAHRGPDAGTTEQIGDIYLGHRRLSIIDLENGHQPMSIFEQKLTISYNGEIYNFMELRTELEKIGCVFETRSDTEVILHAYAQWGVDAFARLNGIFSFAIVDQRGETPILVLARDHFGIKPLHYSVQSGVFLFASEQKSILVHPEVKRELNHQTLHYHLNLRYSPGNETLFKHIYRLPPAHYMIVKNQAIQEIAPYFQLQRKIDHQKSEADWLAEIPHYLEKAIQRQLVSDVPIGVYLSGGMDSGSIVSMMHKLGVEQINTYTLGFNEPTDELDDAAITAAHYQTNHHSLRMNLNPMKQLAQVIWHAEEPKINLLQGFLMSQFVSQDVKVVLGGLGGDELFSGYDIHRFLYPQNQMHRFTPGWAEKYGMSWISRRLFALQKMLTPPAFDEYRRGIQMLLAAGNPGKAYLILRNTWDFDIPMWRKVYHTSFLNQPFNPVMREFEAYFRDASSLSALEQVYHAEIHSKMVNDYLLTEDRMSMAHSVEERVPFLDLELVEFAMTIPDYQKMKGNYTKYLLRKAMSERLPEKIRQKKKWGFTFNPYLQFQKDLKQTAERVLTPERVWADGIFNYNFIKDILDAKPHPRMRWHYNFIWVLTGFYIWKDMYLDSERFREKSIELESYFA